MCFISSHSYPCLSVVVLVHGVDECVCECGSLVCICVCVRMLLQHVDVTVRFGVYFICVVSSLCVFVCVLCDECVSVLVSVCLFVCLCGYFLCLWMFVLF